MGRSTSWSSLLTSSMERHASDSLMIWDTRCWKRKVGDRHCLSECRLGYLPPCRCSLKQHVRRCDYQVAIWKHGDLAMPDIPFRQAMDRKWIMGCLSLWGQRRKNSRIYLRLSLMTWIMKMKKLESASYKMAWTINWTLVLKTDEAWKWYLLVLLW